MRLAPNAERNLAAIMSSMRDSVADHLERLNRHHENLKHTRYGFIVRPLVLTLGWIVVVVGIITIPFPGPGWLTVFIGIAILSLELHWASNLLAWGVRLYDRFFSWYHVQSTRMRYSLIAATIAACWIVGGGIAIVMWKCGMLGILNPIFTPVFS
ncbi:putative membrane protein [Corynebacterium diphtheriae C7 (beta)]|nr:putative membrane protein [Corynebacterium diphtheriae C7 (beta)]